MDFSALIWIKLMLETVVAMYKSELKVQVLMELLIYIKILKLKLLEVLPSKIYWQ